jgi:hypothetical protein
MKKKTARVIPNLNIYPLDSAPVEAILHAEVLVELVHREVLPSIQQALQSKRATAILFQINSSDAYLELPKSEWQSAIDTSILHYSQKEKYEVCNELNMLKSKLPQSNKQLA